MEIFYLKAILEAIILAKHFLATGNGVLLIDFGISITIEESEIDRTGVPCYMAPEIWNDYPSEYQSTLTPAYDIWSVGLTAYEYMLELKKPMYADKDEDDLVKMFRDYDDSIFEKNLHHLNRPEITAVVCHMLRKNPEDRLSAEQLLELDYFQNPTFEKLKEMYDD